MELPPILEEFFSETSVWFMIFMLVSFLIGFFTAAWMFRRVVRVQQRQIRRLKEDFVRLGTPASPPAGNENTASS
ncbi:MAG: hypothetical protein MUD08_07200 [Cytophagales bacterium]|nr:hypothetical protein [Cytophagales bacterium]